MIDEIDYFPRRDQQNKGKTAGDEWGKLKKLKKSGKNKKAETDLKTKEEMKQRPPEKKSLDESE